MVGEGKARREDRLCGFVPWGALSTPGLGEREGFLTQVPEWVRDGGMESERGGLALEKSDGLFLFSEAVEERVGGTVLGWSRVAWACPQNDMAP